MKNYYVSTFISGLSKVVEQNLKQKISDIEIIKTFDGIIIYKSNETSKIMNLKFINNTFLLLGLKKSKIGTNFNAEMNELQKKLNLNFDVIKNHIKTLKNQSFKIMAIDKNQPVSINYKIINNLEKSISKNLNIHVNTKKPNLEFIFLRRTEELMLFMLKLTYNRVTEKKLFKGELRPELAYLLASLANLDENKIVIDPFCGHGAIPRQIVKNLKYNMCFASDIDEDLIKKFKNEYKNNKKKLFIKQRDALDLSYFENGFIDAIVTDPPWNIYDNKDEDFSQFYTKMLNEFNRILKESGILIILMGNIIDFEKALRNIDLFKIQNQYNILVNGKKANIYVLYKNK